MTKSVHVLIHECRGYELALLQDISNMAVYENFSAARQKVISALSPDQRGTFLPGEITLLEKWGLR